MPTSEPTSLAEWMGPGEASRLDRADLADLEVAVEAVLAGGREVMRRYRGRDPAEVEEKAPGDPVTEADREADRTIVRTLRRLRPGEPVLSEEGGGGEEGAVAGGDDDPGDGHLWVVDPLDGTKEFLARNGEFAVMVGLAVAGGARLGAVYRPDPGVLWFGSAAGGAWRARLREDRRVRGGDDGAEADRGGGDGAAAADERIRGLARETGGADAVERGPADPVDARGGSGEGESEDDGEDAEPEVEGLGDFRRPVPLDVAPGAGPVRIVHSRSHRPEGLETLAGALGETELVPSGSAGLKCALVASGGADLYVHPVPYLKEWDTCAPEAVLRGAGGRVTDCRGERLRYGKADPSQPAGLFAARPEVWERAAEAVARLAP
jgi:3'-phosphoadenosine 5'-phosphosulfate (PAPS) 3'-phosphatase